MATEMGWLLSAFMKDSSSLAGTSSKPSMSTTSLASLVLSHFPIWPEPEV